MALSVYPLGAGTRLHAGDWQAMEMVKNPDKIVSGFEVTLLTGKVRLSPGSGVFGGFTVVNPSNLDFSVSPAPAGFRYDRLVIRISIGTESPYPVVTAAVAIKEGPSGPTNGSQIRPDLTTTTGLGSIYECTLAYFNVPAGTAGVVNDLVPEGPGSGTIHFDTPTAPYTVPVGSSNLLALGLSVQPLWSHGPAPASIRGVNPGVGQTPDWIRIARDGIYTILYFLGTAGGSWGFSSASFLELQTFEGNYYQVFNQYGAAQLEVTRWMPEGVIVRPMIQNRSGATQGGVHALMAITRHAS